jgi:hypothetical protein
LPTHTEQAEDNFGGDWVHFVQSDIEGHHFIMIYESSFYMGHCMVRILTMELCTALPP